MARGRGRGPLHHRKGKQGSSVAVGLTVHKRGGFRKKSGRNH